MTPVDSAHSGRLFFYSPPRCFGQPSAMVVDELELLPANPEQDPNLQRLPAAGHQGVCEHSQQQYPMHWQTVWGTQSFPQELIDTTIDYLQYDKAALQKCCLVHPMWLDAARFHLFRSLRVSNAPHNAVSGKRHKEAAMPKNFQAFLAFISYEASDGFCASVRTLFMIGDEKDQDRDTRTPVDTQMLASIMMRLPQLRVFDLCTSESPTSVFERLAWNIPVCYRSGLPQPHA
ncbi:hypothetical protein BC835DRAFT_391439 [Cytidiella melzeri]|nr:hypothetical protein BC835DRAFT_391439 [Cytidiella melzeri]